MGTREIICYPPGSFAVDFAVNPAIKARRNAEPGITGSLGYPARNISVVTMYRIDRARRNGRRAIEAAMWLRVTDGRPVRIVCPIRALRSVSLAISSDETGKTSSSPYSDRPDRLKRIPPASDAKSE